LRETKAMSETSINATKALFQMSLEQNRASEERAHLLSVANNAIKCLTEFTQKLKGLK
jgi:hypothetical protein